MWPKVRLVPVLIGQTYDNKSIECATYNFGYLKFFQNTLNINISVDLIQCIGKSISDNSHKIPNTKSSIFGLTEAQFLKAYLNVQTLIEETAIFPRIIAAFIMKSKLYT